MFLISTFVPSGSGAGRAERHVGVAAERALLHPDVGDVERLERGAQLAQVGGGLLGRAHVGLAHALHERHAGAVEVDRARTRRRGSGRGARRACVLPVSSSMWTRVMPMVRVEPSARSIVEVAAHADRQVVLADLVVLRHVRVEVVLPVEQRVRRDRRSPSARPILMIRAIASRLGTGKRPGVPQAHGTGVRVGLAAERVGARAEHLRGRRELDMAFEPDDGISYAPIGRLAYAATPLGIPTDAPVPWTDGRGRAPTSLTVQVWTVLGALYFVWGTTYLGDREGQRDDADLVGAAIRFLVAGAVLFAWSAAANAASALRLPVESRRGRRRLPAAGRQRARCRVGEHGHADGRSWR